MIYGLDLLRRFQTLSNTCLGSTSAIGSGQFSRSIHKATSPGVFLVTCQTTPPTITSHNTHTTEHRRPEHKLPIIIRVQKPDGTIVTGRVFPDSLELSVDKNHPATHSVSPVTCSGIGTVASLYNVGEYYDTNLHQSWFLVRLLKDEHLVVFANAIPDTNATYNILYLSPTYIERPRVEI